MAGFNGRRAPNVSQYIANLNAINPSRDVAAQQDENFNLEDDLAVFTNAEFFDFDLGDGIEHPPIQYDASHEERARRENAATHKNGQKVDFINESFTFANLPPFLATSPATASSIESNFHPSLAFSSSTSPPPYGTYPALPSSATASINTSTQLPQTSPITNRSSPTSPSPSHFAAEEDKRRRNTAASARFRVKKKQREQALERTAKELGDRTKELEKRVGQLETENEWLRGLLVQRNGGIGLESVAKDKAAAEKAENEKDKKQGVSTTEAA